MPSMYEVVEDLMCQVFPSKMRTIALNFQTCAWRLSQSIHAEDCFLTKWQRRNDLNSRDS